MTMPDFYCGTRITEPPDCKGPAGHAWRVTLPPPGQRARKDWDGTVGIYIVRVPGAHPCWDHWFVSLIHLRPIDGVRPAVIRVDGATHEFNIASIDPTFALPGLDAGAPDWDPRFLRPIDVTEQFAAADDLVADRVLELAVHAMVNGFGSPDQDWRPWWKRAIATTAQHYAAGLHSTGGRS